MNELFSNGLNLTITLLAFDWCAHHKAIDLLMIGHRGGTRSLLGGQCSYARGSNGYHREVNVDLCFVRIGWQSVAFDSGEVLREWTIP